MAGGSSDYQKALFILRDRHRADYSKLVAQNKEHVPFKGDWNSYIQRTRYNSIIYGAALRSLKEMYLAEYIKIMQDFRPNYKSQQHAVAIWTIIEATDGFFEVKRGREVCFESSRLKDALSFIEKQYS